MVVQPLDYVPLPVYGRAELNIAKRRSTVSYKENLNGRKDESLMAPPFRRAGWGYRAAIFGGGKAAEFRGAADTTEHYRNRFPVWPLRIN